MVATLSQAEVVNRRKSEWLDAPPEFFAMDTFGDLKLGEKFIVEPLPGDNDGHGGFKGPHNIFTKTLTKVSRTESGIPYGIPHGRAINDKRKVESDFPHSMSVIRVE